MSCDVGDAAERVGGGGSAHSPILPSLHLRHSSFALINLSVASSASQIIQPFRRFTYVTTCSPTLLSLHLRHIHFTYVTWRTAHEPDPQSLILDTPLDDLPPFSPVVRKSIRLIFLLTQLVFGVEFTKSVLQIILCTKHSVQVSQLKTGS